MFSAKPMVVALIFLLTSSAVVAESLLIEGFESANLNISNADGFNWKPPGRTTIVTASNIVWQKGSTVSVPKPAGADWTPRSGSGQHSLRFEYAVVDGVTGNAEQRFELGRGYRELWIRYWIRVPTNFAHHNPTGGSNNKWFAIWMDGYSSLGIGPTVVQNFWPDNTRGTHDSYFTWSLSNSGYPYHHGYYNGFIRYPEDQGRWMQVVTHVKCSSAPGVSDGLAQFWRRWENEPNFTLLSESLNRPFYPPPGGPDGWANGYILGAANSGYSETTEFLVDDFEISTESLLDVSPRPFPPKSITLE